jgi:SWI/SNF-related matrix-associated actin-dependent regulator of chromatin subfamily D
MHSKHGRIRTLDLQFTSRLFRQEALKRPMKQKRKLRIFISNTAFPANEPAAAGAAAAKEPGAAPPAAEGPSTTCWELRVEGRLIDEDKKVSVVAVPGSKIWS